MPSKYSHSVVLAQQSSRGLINLPNDQYIDYLRSSPLLTTKLPPRSTTAPPIDRTRANSVKTDREGRNPSQNSIRQQSSFDQLSASAYQPVSPPSGGPLRRQVLDLDVSSDEDDESSSVLSGPAVPSSSKSQQPRKIRLPQRLPIELHQRAMQNGVLTPIPQSPRVIDPKPATKPLPKQKTNARPSIELPIQQTARSEISKTQSRSITTTTHRRDISAPSTVATPQLSPTGTDLTRADKSPHTPFSPLQKDLNITIVEDVPVSLSRDDFTLSRHTKPVDKMAMKTTNYSSNVGGFFDVNHSGDPYVKNKGGLLHEADNRFANVRANEVSTDAAGILTSTNKVSTGKSASFARTPPSTVDAPRQSFDRTDSLSSLSSMSSFGKPSVSQKTNKPQTSAAAMKARPESPITAHQAIFESVLPKNTSPRSATPQGTRSRFSALSKTSPESQLVTSLDLMSLPVIPTESLKFKQQFDPSLLASTATSSSSRTGGAKSGQGDFLRRISEDDANDEDAASPPPDISRIPSVMRMSEVGMDPMSELFIDRKGGVMSPRSREMAEARAGSSGTDGKDHKKSRLFRSLRVKGKKW